MTEIRFQLTEADLIEAQRLYQKTALPLYFKWVGGGICVLMLVLAIMGETTMSLLMIASWAAFAMSAIPAIGYFWRIPRMAAKAYAHDKALSEEATLHWDEKDIGVESPTARWSQPISSFAGWQANEEMLLLFRQTHLFHMVPTRAFPNPGTRADLINRLKDSGVSSKWPPK